MTRTQPLGLASLALTATLLTACSGGTQTAELGDGPPVEITINSTAPAEQAADSIEHNDDPPAETAAVASGSHLDTERRQRCIHAIGVLDRRWEEEDFEYPDERPELSEEELEQTMAPAQPFADGVAAPSDRPALVAMPDFDPETMPIPQLDRFRESCFEQGLVTEAEIYGDDDWCEELASFPLDEVRAFAAEDGEDTVREEFEACGLPNPLDS